MNAFSGNLVVQMLIVVGLLVSTALFHRRNKTSEVTSIRQFLGRSLLVVKGNRTIQLLVTGAFLWGMLSIPEHTMFNLEVPEDGRASFLSFASLVLQLGGIVGSIVLAVAGSIFAVSGLGCGLLPKRNASSNQGDPMPPPQDRHRPI